MSRAQKRRAKIRELRATGMSMRAIAEEVGCSVGTVHYALNHPDGQGGHLTRRE
ncbi:helix-turn-helix domain-containing protein [Brevibacterium yomogidense]